MAQVIKPPKTARYIITAPDGRFLYDLWQGQGWWTAHAHDPLQTCHSWLSFENATAKLKEACTALKRNDLFLSLVTLEKHDDKWALISQQGVASR